MKPFKTVIYLGLFSSLSLFMMGGESLGSGDLLLNQSRQVTDSYMTSEDILMASEKKLGDFHGLKAVLAWSLGNNPTLRASRAGLEAVREKMPQARANWLPTLSADADITNTEVTGSAFGGDTDTTTKGIGAGFSQPLYRGGSSVAAIENARNLIEAQEILFLNLVQDILFEVATAYVDVLRDQRLFNLSESNRDVIGEELAATRDRFEVGELTRTDVAQAEARLARADSDLISVRGDLERSRAVYERVVGVMPAEIRYPDLDIKLPQTLDDAILIAEKENPEVRAAKYIHRAAEEDVDNVFGELLPQLDFFGSWDKDYDPQPGLVDDSTNKSIGLTAKINFYTGGSTRSRIREAKQTANQRYMEILETGRRIRQETIIAWRALETAEAEIVSRKKQVEAAEIAREGVSQESELGARTILDTLDAEQELLDAQVDYTTAQRNKILARFAVARTLGQFTPEYIGF